MSALRRHALPCWLAVGLICGIVTDSIVSVAVTATCAIWLMVCDRELAHLDAEAARLRAEYEQATTRIIDIPGGWEVAIPAGMSRQRVAELLWLASREIEAES